MDELLPIQSPPTGPFSSSSLQWSRGGIAHIPLGRLADFQDGEGRRIDSMETSFFKRAGYHNPGAGANWLIKLTMWCAFGPQNVPNRKSPATPPRKGTYPKEGPGSRPRARKTDYNEHQKRGCQCHYKVTQYKDDPHIAVIHFVNREHVNKEGNQCHGSMKESSIENPTWSIKNQIAPRLSIELKKHLLDMLRAGMSVLTIHDIHCLQQASRAGPDSDLTCSTIIPLNTLDGRDDFLCKKDLYNLQVQVQRETTRFHDNDLISIRKWIEKNQERVVLQREYKIGPPEVEFILALQSPWQLAQMIELSHGRVLALDSTFATNKYGFPFFTLVCFDRHQMGLPVGWSIQLRETADMIQEFLQGVKDRAQKVMPDWMPSCFIIDCAEAEVNAILIVFPGIAIYFCSYHVRRAWKDALIKKVRHKVNIVQMNDDLGDIMYADTTDEMWELWLQYCEKYNDEKPFLEYFKEEWLTKPEKWMRALRSMNRANQQTNGATEAWHLTLKKMLSRWLGGLQARRLDALVAMLFGPMLAFFMSIMKRKQFGLQINYKVEEIILSSLHLAEHELKNAKVSFPDPSRPNKAIVDSVKTPGKQYEVRNIYSHFPSCDCKWADQGNMCKHQVKALLVRGHAGGTIVKQNGTRFGSVHQGIAHTDGNVEVCEPAVAEMITEEHAHDHERELAMVHVDDMYDVDNLNHTSLDTVEADVNSDPPETNPPTFHDLVAQMTSMVEGNPQLYDNALVTMQVAIDTMHKMKEGLTPSAASDVVQSTNHVLQTVHKFVRPLGLTSKRRLGIVDLYHRARRAKKRQAFPKKKRGPKRKQVPSETQVDDANSLPEQPAAIPSPPEPVPDQPPTREALRRESMREELNRHRHAAVTGTSSRRTAKNTPGKIPLPPLVREYSEGLRTDMDPPGEIDLNATRVES